MEQRVRTKNTRDILPFSYLLQNSLVAHLQSPFLTIEHVSGSMVHDVHNPNEILPFFPWNVFGCKFSEGGISDFDQPRQELSCDHHLRGRERRSVENRVSVRTGRRRRCSQEVLRCVGIHIFGVDVHTVK